MDNAATSHVFTCTLIGGAAFITGLFIGAAGKVLAIGPWLRVVFSGGDVGLLRVIGMRLLMRVGYRLLGLVGTATLAIGAFLMTFIGAGSSQALMMVFVALMGIGMGLAIPSFLVAIQTMVERRYLGTATSMLQFSRSIGGTLGVSVMGAALSIQLASNLAAAGLDAGLVTRLLDPLTGAGTVADARVAQAMAGAMHWVFVIAFVASFLGLLAAFLAPHRELGEASQAAESDVNLAHAD